MKRLTLWLALLLWCSQLSVATVTIDGATTYQVIDGFGVNANHRSWKGDELKPVLDALIDQAGMTLFRIVLDNTDWEASNDNSDPALMDWTYYNPLYGSAEFTQLWDLLAYLNSRGITEGAFFNFMGPGPAWMGGGSITPGLEEEWAEMITSLLVYARDTRGLHFGLLAPDNEPDISGEGIQMDAGQYLSALEQLVQKLDANGLGDVQLVGPDLASNPAGYLPELLADPGVMARLGHIGIHRYVAGAGGVYDDISNSPYPDRTVWVTEFNVWCSGCDSGQRGSYDWSYCRGTAEYLLSQLADNASAGIVWEGYDSFYLHGPGTWSFWGLFSVDNEKAAVKTYTPRKNFYTVAQISRFVRPGARRIAVSGSTTPFTGLLAFNHSGSGQVTLVGINPSSHAEALSGTLASLPAMPYLELYYTSPTKNLAYGGRVTVSNGSFSAKIPANCVFTLSYGVDVAAFGKGTYNGLFDATSGTARESSGWLTLSTTRKGLFSGRICVGGVKNSFHGAFDASRQANVVVSRRGKAALNLRLQLEETDTLSGTVGDGAWTASLHADRAVFSSAKSCGYAGLYTFTIPGKDNQADRPGGDSYGTFKVSSSGRVTLSGSLADGTKVSQGTSVAGDGSLPLFVSLYRGAGVLIGWIRSSADPAASMENPAVWIKSLPKSGRLRYYPVEFNEPVTLYSTRYTPPGKQPVFGFNDGTVVLMGGNLPAPLTNAVRLLANNRFEVVAPAAANLRLKLSPASGKFSGSFSVPPSRKSHSFRGVLMRQLNGGAGYFLGTDQSGSVRIGLAGP